MEGQTGMTQCIFMKHRNCTKARASQGIIAFLTMGHLMAWNANFCINSGITRMQITIYEALISCLSVSNSLSLSSVQRTGWRRPYADVHPILTLCKQYRQGTLVGTLWRVFGRRSVPANMKGTGTGSAEPQWAMPTQSSREWLTSNP